MGLIAYHPVKRPDGRSIRLLERNGCRSVLQEDVLHLVGAVKGTPPSLDPKTESPFGIHDFDESVSSNYLDLRDLFTRIKWYGFHRKGFENDDLPLGDSIVYVERGIEYTLLIPSLILPSGVNLRDAKGIGYVDITKLTYDPASHTVSFGDEIVQNPHLVYVADAMRPSGWSVLFDNNGIPLMRGDSNSSVSNAKYLRVRDFDTFQDGATGWHGSMILNADRSNDRYKYIITGRCWCLGTQFAVIELGH